MMSYLAWNALNTGENGSDFQTIARDTNFRFNTHKGRVNWSQIDKLSIDRLMDEQNVAILGHNINNVVNFDIESEFDVRILNSNFVKIFKLSQLTNDFLLHCKRHLSQQKFLLKGDLEKVSRKLMNARKENVELKKIIHWNKWRPAGCDGTQTPDISDTAMCSICGKVFQFESFLIMHYNRRHPGVTTPSHKPDYDKEPGECCIGGVNPSTSVVDGLRIGTSRDPRYTAELESLRNLITSKLGSSYRSDSNRVATRDEKPTSSRQEAATSDKPVVASTAHMGPRAPEVAKVKETPGAEKTGEFPERMVESSRQGAGVQAQERDKISKEEYDNHFKTIDNSWRKQFEELDKKYQNEIKKLQEELKFTMEQNKLNCEKLISEKENVRRNGEVKKSAHIQEEDESSSQRSPRPRIKERDEINEKVANKTADNKGSSEKNTRKKELQNIFIKNTSIEEHDRTNHRNVMKEEIDNVTIDKRRRDHQKSEMLDQSISSKTDNFMEIVKNIQGELSKTRTLTRQTSLNEFTQSKPLANVEQNEKELLRSRGINRGTCDVDLEPINIKKNEQGNKIKQNEIKDNTDQDRNKTTEPVAETSKTSDSRTTNYKKFLDFLKENDEFTKKQIGHPAKEKSTQDENKKSFFTGIDPNLFDFSRETTMNGLFFNDEFERDIAKYARVNPKPLENTLKKNIKLNDNPFSESRERMQKLFSVELNKPDNEGRGQNPLSHLESLLGKIEDERLLDNVTEPQPILDEKVRKPLVPPTSQYETDFAHLKVKEGLKERDKTTGCQLKHSTKSFSIPQGNFTEQTRLQIAAVSSEETFDQIISITNPDREFDYEVIETSSCDSSKSDKPEASDKSTRDEAFAEYKGDSQITVTRAEYEILAKDLSVIVEETETEDSRSTSMLMEVKNKSKKTENTISSSSEGTSTSTSNPESDSPKFEAQVLKVHVTEKSDTNKQKAESPSSDSFEHSTDGKVKAISSNTTTATIHPPPVSEIRDASNRWEEKPPVLVKEKSPARSNKDQSVNTDNTKTTQANNESGKDRTLDPTKKDNKVHKATSSQGMYAGLDEPECSRPQKSKEKNGPTKDAKPNKPEDKLKVRADVVNQLERVMRRLNVNSEWTRLPAKSFEQKMKVMEHERNLKRKNKVNFEAIKNRVQKKIENILKKKLAGSLKEVDSSKRKPDEGRLMDLNKEKRSENIHERTSNTLDLVGKNLSKDEKIPEKSKKKLKIDNIVNKKIVDVLSKDLLKKSEEIGRKAIQQDETVNVRKAPSSNFESKKVSQLNESSMETVIKEMEYTSTLSVGKEDQDKTSEQQSKVGTSKQFESRLTKNLYQDDMLDRETDYLQTNNFTSKQPITTSRSVGYNFFGKSKETSSNLKGHSSDKSDIEGTTKDVLSQPSSLKESSTNNGTPGSSQDGLDNKLLLVTAPYDLLTASTSESNFQIRRSKPQSKSKSKPKVKEDFVVNRFDCENTAPPITRLINDKISSNKSLDDAATFISQVHPASRESLTQAYLVNERNVSDIVAPVSDDTPFAGTIRSIAKAIQDGEESDSFELDDFLEKNNMG